MSASRKGLKLSDETKAKISESRRAQIGGKKSVIIQVIDIVTGKKLVYSSMSEAASSLNVPVSSISMYISRGTIKPFKNRYKISKVQMLI